MSKQMNKSKLGKGMAALLNSGASYEESEHKEVKKKGNELQNEQLLVPIDKIIANKEQPRKIFNEAKIEELSKSIKENGIIQPLIVTAIEDGKLELIAGERRLRASKKAGIEMVPVVIKRVTKKDSLVMAIIENVQRSDLNCVEEALAYFQLMNDFNLTQEEVAKKIGKERSSIANYLRILKLPREVVDLLQKEKLSMGHAKVLAAIKDEEEVKIIAKKAAEENLSVREVEILAKKNRKAAQPSDKDEFEDLSHLRNKIENKTGFHIKLKKKKTGKGAISIQFNNEDEFNKIYEFLLK